MNPLQLEIRSLDAFDDPLATFQNEFSSSRHKFFLESSVVRAGFSRFSFMGDTGGPLGEAWTYDAATKQITIEYGDRHVGGEVDDFFGFLDERLKQRRLACPTELPFAFNLGYVCTLGYELKSETIGAQTYLSPTCDAAGLLATRMIVFDHAEHRCHLLHLVSSSVEARNAVLWFDAVEKRMKELGHKREPRRESAREPAHITPTPPAARADRKKMSLAEVENWIARHARMRHSKDSYIRKIKEAQREIGDGESYEICLTNLIDLPFPVPPFDLYCAMRLVTPAPHAGYFNVGDFHLASSSPERFLSIDRAGLVQAKPIKGTRPRGRTMDEDSRLVADLSGDEKDRAENLMIVDLLRNDLGQVCTLSSVHVPKLFDVESYSHVHQLVSTIQGQLKPGISSIECVRAAFPGGSMTGAPKKRTMDIIDRLEEGPRGTYSGALGWFGLSGACDLNIVIRSVIVSDDHAYFGVGGAITAMSDPEGEFSETMVKARGVVEVVDELLSRHEQSTEAEEACRPELA